MSAGSIIGAQAVIAVTFFRNYAATTKHEEALRLHDLANRISTTSASSKAKLPWLKLARFGHHRTGMNSLRSNENVLTISGVEGDYDRERVPFDDACEILRQAGVAAIVYTSPSHTEDAPRWRVLCPLSEEAPPEQRSHHLARLNGLFGGIFSTESWTLSQSYFYGSINRSPSHRVELIDGTPIDLMDELDAGTMGKPTKAAAGNGAERPISSGGPYTPASDARLEAFRVSVLDNLRRQAVDGQKHIQLRNAARLLGGIQVAAGFTDAVAVRWLLNALPASVKDWALAARTATWGLEQGRAAPIVLEDRPREHWRHARPVSQPAGSSEQRPTTNLPAYYPPITELRDEALRRLEGIINTFIADAAMTAAARAEVKQRRKDALSDMPDATKADKMRLTKRIIRHVAERYGFPKGKLPRPDRKLLTGSQGIGKTTIALKAIARITETIVVRMYAPTLEKAQEALRDYRRLANESSMPALVVRGRGAPDLSHDDGTPMCPRHEVVTRAAKMGVSPGKSICPTCALNGKCGDFASAKNDRKYWRPCAVHHGQGLCAPALPGAQRRDCDRR